MTFPISPGVYDREIDASVTTIQAAGSPAAFVANLDWGPVLTRKLITSEEQLKRVYSRPFLENNYDFLLASQFLSYSDNLLLTRVSSGNNSIGGRSNYYPIDPPLNDCGETCSIFSIAFDNGEI